MATVVEDVRALLAAAQAAGQPFNTAWAAAVDQATAGGPEGDDWRAALNATRPAWRAAWHQYPARQPERALLALADDPDRIPLPADASDRDCEHCGDPIPLSRRQLARYCSRECQRSVSRRPQMAA